MKTKLKKIHKMCNRHKLKLSLVQTFSEFSLNKLKALALCQTIMHARDTKNNAKCFFFFDT